MTNQFQHTDPEWLAHEALEATRGNTAAAVANLRMAINALLLWQRMALFDAPAGPEEPRHG